MTQILLISDTPRVKQIFETLEKQDSLQLRTAAALNQADQEIQATPPDFTFVQSRISGFSGEIIVRHLKKGLPEGARIVLLVSDFEEMEQAYQQEELFLDLTLSDDALTVAIYQILEGTYQVTKPVPQERSVPAALAEVGVETAGVEIEAIAEAGTPGATAAAECAALGELGGTGLVASAGAPEPEAGPESPESVSPEPESPRDVVPPELAPPQDLAPPKTFQATTFAELIDHGAAGDEQEATVPPAVTDKVSLGAPPPPSFDEAIQRELAGRKATVRQLGENELIPGEPLADALRRIKKKKKPLWVPLLAAALVAVPLIGYLAGKKAAPPESGSGQQAPKSKKALAKQNAASSAAATPNGAAKPAPATPAPGGAPAAPAKGVVPGNPATAVVKPAAPAAVVKGVSKLPGFVTQGRQDAEYGKTHPGWQRYFATGVEFKVFKQGELYQALQVLAQDGGTIPDQLYKGALREFGGRDAFPVQPAGQKGKYLVEQGYSQGVALTVYRSKGDKRMKAFVLYYR